MTARKLGDAMRYLFGCLLLAALTACTAVNVRPVENVDALDTVCIVENDRVPIDDILEVLQEGFRRNGVDTRIVTREGTGSCETVLTYMARRYWDVTFYMTSAELWLWRDNVQIGYAEYHLRNNGGMSLAKWKSTRAKLDPVIDELLADKS